MITITAASASGPTISRAQESPTRTTTAAARPISTRSIGDELEGTSEGGAELTASGYRATLGTGRHEGV